ncbi:SGNH/GDSL hydrolase family protein [Chryseobacterium sp. RP-3-3]|uniref:SGNH/GDSL hydrolase family protein n=1 Tax=Chryseobacterium antibioticum TaxID=2728847 RepID=A0A7Y0ALR1_9FLAO|nr:SGNH/GDSL hydrolase family protein [Chryseobacterium antibioticum]NML69485.1 SGNH/GDSL hydrolase family protein [Chryseobacterium antibioticum]
MKKKIVLSSVLLTGVFCFVYFWNKYSYAGEENYFSSGTKPETGLQIGIIGDSWVVRQNLDSLLEKKLLDKGVQSEIYSSGNPGAKTKRIYENLFKDDGEEFSSKKVIDKKPDYCIVIAGVNDAATHVGPEFYTHHMVMIIKTLLHYNIKPVVVSLPEFGVEEDFKNKNIISSLSNRGAELFLNGGTEFKIPDYRTALLEDLKRNGLDKKAAILNFDEVSKDFDKNRNLYADPLHLNKQGYQKFSEFLAKGIVNLAETK